MGDIEKAEDNYLKALECNEDVFEPAKQLAKLYADAEDYSAGIEYASLALLIREDIEVYNLLAALYLTVKQLDKALETINLSLVVRDDISDTWNIAGNILSAMKEEDKALKYYNMAVSLNNRNIPALHSMAVIYLNQGHIKKCDQTISRINHIKKLPEIKYLTAFSRLYKGDYKEAWVLYENRKLMPDYKKNTLGNFKEWRGTKLLKTKKLCIYSEQGLGDLLMFSRYIPYIKALAPNFSIVVNINQYENWDNPLEEPPSFKKLMLNIHDSVLIKGWDDTSCDYQVSMMSLPFLLQLDHIPEPVTLNQYELPQTIKKIGVCWKGSTAHSNNHRRSILHKVDINNNDITLLSLENPDINNLDDLIAKILEQDLIITIDSMVAHLSLFLGKPTWLLTDVVPEWRWDGKWYPNVTVYKQISPGNWQEIFDTLTRVLKNYNFDFAVKLHYNEV